MKWTDTILASAVLLPTYLSASLTCAPTPISFATASNNKSFDFRTRFEIICKKFGLGPIYPRVLLKRYYGEASDRPDPSTRRRGTMREQIPLRWHDQPAYLSLSTGQSHNLSTPARSAGVLASNTAKLDRYPLMDGSAGLVSIFGGADCHASSIHG